MKTTLYVLENTTTHRAWIGTTRAPRQLRYDLLRRALAWPSKDALTYYPHPLYEDIQRLGKDSFSWTFIPCHDKHGEKLARKKLDERYPLQYTKPVHITSKSFTAPKRKRITKALTKEKKTISREELIASYMVSGESRASAERLATRA